MIEQDERPERKNRRALFASATLALVGALALGGCGSSQPCESSEPLDNPRFPTRIELPNGRLLLLGTDSLMQDGYSAQTFEDRNGNAGKRLTSTELSPLGAGVFRTELEASPGYSLVVEVSEAKNTVETICVATD